MAPVCYWSTRRISSISARRCGSRSCMPCSTSHSKAATRCNGWCALPTSIMPAPDRYAVIGHPIAHSRSPQIHSLFAQQTRQNMIYTAIDVAPQDLASRVGEFFAAGGRGLNVTVPHKEAVIALTSSLSARARTAGAANTIMRDAQGRLTADNTDGAGLVRDLTHNLR